VDPTFPLHLWDRLLPQAEITLNLLRTSRLHPQLSAAAHFHGLVDYNKTYFAPPGCKIIGHYKPGKLRTWAPHGQHGYSLGPDMHHYRCQNVYIAATASERIEDTLEFSPHNFPMPQLSFTDILIMADNDMSNELKNPHHEVPFVHIGDDTIVALTKLAEIFKTKFQKVQTQGLPNVPATASGHTIPTNLSQPILASPVHQQLQTRSQTIINTKGTTNAPLLPRVVTAMTSRPAPPRVPMRSQNLSPRNLSQEDFWDMETANMDIALGNHHWSQQHHANAVVHPVTGKEMEYTALMKDPSLQPLWKRGFGNELGRLFQGIRDIPVTDTCFFVKLTNIPKDRNITYG
jgi:hypothetical protein